jgi:hypothetical protein
VQAYVVDEGNGDLNSLRTANVDPGRPGFRIFSADNVEESTDFAGVLVGVQQSPTRLWYVYVVGEVTKEQLKGTRLAALSQTDGQFLWQMGQDDGVATAAYRQHHERGRAASGNPSQAILTFPNAGDQFELQNGGETITVRETSSGAQWTMSVAQGTN